MAVASRLGFIRGMAQWPGDNGCILHLIQAHTTPSPLSSAVGRRARPLLRSMVLAAVASHLSFLHGMARRPGDEGYSPQGLF